MNVFSSLCWSLRLDCRFITGVPGISLVEKFRFIFLKYLIYLKNRLFGMGSSNSVMVFGRRFFYNDVFGLASLQRVYCAGAWLKQYLHPGSVILDVGANVGQFAFFCRQYLNAARVVSIEPLSDCFSLLRLNSGNSSDCLNCVVSTREGEVLFHVASESSQLSSYVRDDRKDYRDSYPVKCMSLDEVAGRCGVDSVDLVKVDTEGSEYEVLCSGEAVLDKSAAVLVELSIFRKSAASLFRTGSLLEDKGFMLAELLLDGTDRPNDVDGLFLRP